MAWTLVEWEERFCRFENSQMSVSSFCDVEEVSVASFYRWRKKLADASLSMAAVASVSPMFQQVEVASVDSGVVIDSSRRATKIRIGGGIEIELGTDVDVDDVIAGIVRFATQSATGAQIESPAGGA